MLLHPQKSPVEVHWLLSLFSVSFTLVSMKYRVCGVSVITVSRMRADACPDC